MLRNTPELRLYDTLTAEISDFRDPEMERLKVAHLKQNQVVLELQ